MTFTCNVTFAGYIGSDTEYVVDAENEEDAIQEAIGLAEGDLTIEDIAESDEGEYEVTVGFGEYVGIEETYTAYCDNESDAENVALEMAKDDLEAEILYEEDEDEDF